MHRLHRHDAVRTKAHANSCAIAHPGCPFHTGTQRAPPSSSFTPPITYSTGKKFLRITLPCSYRLLRLHNYGCRSKSICLRPSICVFFRGGKVLPASFLPSNRRRVNFHASAEWCLRCNKRPCAKSSAAYVCEEITLHLALKHAATRLISAS